MIDDERLQELLSKASSLYHSGEYKGAIEAWHEALSVDPESQKAKEGIRMATLLLGDWQPASEPGPSEEAPLEAADGGAEAADLSAEEQEARLDVGIARIKQLMAQRKYSEAIEGARGLLPTSAGSDEVQKLLGEAQQAFESAPFIDEHLTLARELFAQERYAEAEAQCQKVFVLDATHPAAKTLLGQIRERVQQGLARAASQLGGMTVKLSLPQVQAAGRGGKEAAQAARPAQPKPAPEGRAFGGETVIQPGDEPATSGAAPPPESDGDAAREQEEVAARSLLDQAFEQAGVEEPPAAEPPAAPEPEIVEATTIVAPTTRVVPRAPARPAPAAPDPAPPGPASAPAAGAGAAPAAEVPPPAGQDETTAWETELTQLNLKVGEREILKGTGAKAAAVSSSDGSEADLMSLLDTNLGGQAAPAPGGAAAGKDHAAGSIPVAGIRPATAGPKEAPREGAPVPAKWKRETTRPEPALVESAEPVLETKPRPRDRTRPAPSAGRRSWGGKFLLLLILLAAGGGAGWWFYLGPGSAGGAGWPRWPLAPPSGSSPPNAVDPGQTAIPTPIGGGTRQPNQEPQDGPPPQPGGSAVAAAAAPPPGGPGAPAAGTASAGQSVAPPSRPQATNPEPIKPPTPQLSPEEIHRRVAVFTADGRRLLAQGKWREARAKLNAAQALDPANFQIKELTDQAQAKIDAEQQVQDEFDSMKKMFDEKEYEKALFKLYRLPRDRNLGDIDRYIRNGWYNWAATLMKAGNPTDALRKLSEALDVDPDDAAALQIQEVAERYRARAKDATYWAYCDKLKLRTLDQR